MSWTSWSARLSSLALNLPKVSASQTNQSATCFKVALAKGDGLFWVMPVEKVARQIWTAIRKKKSKVYVTKRWHILAIINKNLPFGLYKRM